MMRVTILTSTCGKCRMRQTASYRFDLASDNKGLGVWTCNASSCSFAQYAPKITEISLMAVSRYNYMSNCNDANTFTRFVNPAFQQHSDWQTFAESDAARISSADVLDRLAAAMRSTGHPGRRSLRHSAEGDCLMLMPVCRAYGQPFVDECDKCENTFQLF
ncbi:unnamed protein product [Sphagnum balticum]